MNDKLIRKALADWILRHDSTAVVFHELPIYRGIGRADCVSVNGSITGFEIKGRGDKLSRLPKQVCDYETVCDYCNVVVTGNHLLAVRKHVPSHWGITLAFEDGRDILFRIVRKSTKSSRTKMDAVIKLMWKQEAVKALRNNRINCKANASICEIWDHLQKLSHRTICKEVRIALKARGGSSIAAR